MNRKTGEIKQVGETNDQPDRILKTNGKGVVKTDREGSPKVAIDNIDKGILSDGMNLRNKGNVISIGGEGNATKEGVESFALDLSEYVGKEIGGGYYSNDETKELTHMTIGAYKDNTYTKNTSKGVSALRDISGSMEEFNSYKVKGYFHTHPNESTRFEPSDADKTIRNNALRQNPKLNFYILTHPQMGGGKKPHIINYTR